MVKQIECKCGLTVRKDRLKQHQRSKRCVLLRSMDKMSKKKYDITYSQKLISLVRDNKFGIPYTQIPVKYEYFIPEAVAEAHYMWNASDSPFKGIPYKDFMIEAFRTIKSKPNKKKGR